MRRLFSVPAKPDKSIIVVWPRFSTGMKFIHGIGAPSVHERFATCGILVWLEAEVG